MTSFEIRLAFARRKFRSARKHLWGVSIGFFLWLLMSWAYVQSAETEAGVFHMLLGVTYGYLLTRARDAYTTERDYLRRTEIEGVSTTPYAEEWPL